MSEAQVWMVLIGAAGVIVCEMIRWTRRADARDKRKAREKEELEWARGVHPYNYVEHDKKRRDRK